MEADGAEACGRAREVCSTPRARPQVDDDTAAHLGHVRDLTIQSIRSYEVERKLTGAAFTNGYFAHLQSLTLLGYHAGMLGHGCFAHLQACTRLHVEKGEDELGWTGADVVAMPALQHVSGDIPISDAELSLLPRLTTLGVNMWTALVPVATGASDHAQDTPMAAGVGSSTANMGVGFTAAGLAQALATGSPLQHLELAVTCDCSQAEWAEWQRTRGNRIQANLPTLFCTRLACTAGPGGQACGKLHESQARGVPLFQHAWYCAQTAEHYAHCLPRPETKRFAMLTVLANLAQEYHERSRALMRMGRWVGITVVIKDQHGIVLQVGDGEDKDRASEADDEDDQRSRHLYLPPWQEPSHPFMVQVVPMIDQTLGVDLAGLLYPKDGAEGSAAHGSAAAASTGDAGVATSSSAAGSTTVHRPKGTVPTPFAAFRTGRAAVTAGREDVWDGWDDDEDGADGDDADEGDGDEDDDNDHADDEGADRPSTEVGAGGAGGAGGGGGAGGAGGPAAGPEPGVQEAAKAGMGMITQALAAAMRLSSEMLGLWHQALTDARREHDDAYEEDQARALAGTSDAAAEAVGQGPFTCYPERSVHFPSRARRAQQLAAISSLATGLAAVGLTLSPVHTRSGEGGHHEVRTDRLERDAGSS